jgi:hypothetical protein
MTMNREDELRSMALFAFAIVVLLLVVAVAAVIGLGHAGSVVKSQLTHHLAAHGPS